MQNNPYYEAVMEGRWQPSIEVKKTADGDYLATYSDINGTRIEKQHEDQGEASRRCSDAIIEGIRNGDIHPFR